MSEFVRPDEFFYLNVEGEEGVKQWMVNAKYDSVDYVKRLGAWMIKAYDDEVGLATLHVDQATALQVVNYALLPVRPRPYLFQSEYEGYMKAQEKMMDRWTE